MSFNENKKGSLVYMTSGKISAVHAFTTRLGGVSGGIFASLNLAEVRGDDNAHVAENYDIICRALGVERQKLVFSRQVHGDAVRGVSAADAHRLFSDVPYEADALVTCEKNVPLIIFTADCTPILLHDPVAGAVGAVHAGWRGTAADIAGKAVGKMVELYGCEAANIRAAIGPCISACCFETGAEVPDAMRALCGAGAEPFIASRGEKFMVDLKGINSLLLARAGLPAENIDVSPECTMCMSDKYWSHRKTNGQRGSQASIIMLKG